MGSDEEARRMDANETRDRGWIGPELPSLGALVMGDVPVHDGWDADVDRDRNAGRDPAVRRRTRHVAHPEGTRRMIEQLVRPELAAVLERCQMPAQEIRWVLAADDPNVVHMLLELHAERLREELAERLRAISEVEASFTEAKDKAREMYGNVH
jgi:hypothetical protein